MNGVRRVKTDSSNENFQFSEWFKYQKDVTKYSTSELADILHVPRRTIEDWLYLGKVPQGDRITEVRRIMSSKKLPPSKRVQAEMKRLHYLTWEPGKNRWRLRVTIERGAKYVGFRKTYNFPKLNAEEAILAKDSVITALESVGLKIHGRGKK